MPTIKYLFTHRFLPFALSFALLCEIPLLAMIQGGSLKFSHEINLEALTALPIFVMGLLQLFYNGRVQKTDFIRSYAEGFFTDRELYSAFHELVYQYTDTRYDAIDAAVLEKEKAKEINGETARPFFDFGAGLPQDRKEGMRFFHPRYFQGSPEERRLDMLIGYFDMLGYHHSQGFVSIQDVAGSFGHYLNILSKRKVIKEVRTVYREAINDSNYAKQNGRIQPFRYFDHLMDAIDVLNAKIEQCKKTAGNNLIY